ncbi:hypothetical protein CALCODRAFT_160380 [Calocera cornea HHB12733]|uniref:Uncharacterized protein n=1 Tax=Calocera cornea HHB12733 TaxID=1353952 RepID=A0A165I2P2_9BASI|nr:hypothetical protein CALCODRAFT_160380 [Calocera cornea HHB12733]
MCLPWPSRRPPFPCPSPCPCIAPKPPIQNRPGATISQGTYQPHGGAPIPRPCLNNVSFSPSRKFFENMVQRKLKIHFRVRDLFFLFKVAAVVFHQRRSCLVVRNLLSLARLRYECGSVVQRSETCRDMRLKLWAGHCWVTCKGVFETGSPMHRRLEIRSSEII